MTFFALYCICAGIVGMCYGICQAHRIHYSYHPRQFSIETHEDKFPDLSDPRLKLHSFTYGPLYPGRIVAVNGDPVSVEEAAEFLGLKLMEVPPAQEPPGRINSRPPRSDMEYFIK